VTAWEADADEGMPSCSFMVPWSARARTWRTRESLHAWRASRARRPARQVLEAAGVEEPKALAVVYTARGRAVTAVAALRAHWPRAPILARALDQLHAAELRAAGADTVVTATAEAGLELGAAVLSGLSADERRARPRPPLWGPARRRVAAGRQRVFAVFPILLLIAALFQSCQRVTCDRKACLELGVGLSSRARWQWCRSLFAPASIAARMPFLLPHPLDLSCGQQAVSRADCPVGTASVFGRRS